jgi:uncharacterized protein (DUF58 family)
LSYKVRVLFDVANVMVIAGAVSTVGEWLYLFLMRNPFTASRDMVNRLSLASENPVRIQIKNNTKRSWMLKVVDEMPSQFQERDFEMFTKVGPKKIANLSYKVTPVERGEYFYGDILLFVGSSINFVKRRVRIPASEMVPVYPSIIQMKQFELYTFPRLSMHYGVKKIRRVGHSYEFEQIKNYTRGDDVRSINWKATGRLSTLMVNQYQEERSQPVYCVLDRSRIMKMPFNGLSLLDYAVNSSLVISNTALNKGDKAGLISYSETVDSTIKADNRPGQLGQIMNSLFKEEQSSGEANYELLNFALTKIIKTRSLLFLFTNFESQYALDRVLNLLRLINKRHLLVVVFFENSELSEYVKDGASDLRQIYTKTAAQEFLYDKEQIVRELRKHKIQTIFTSPEELTINTLNKYLELKARGLI